VRVLEGHFDGCAECRRLVASMAPEAHITTDERASPTQTSGSPRQAAGPDLLIGTTHLDYRVLRKLGAGGMGVVYEAQHVLIGRRAALKVMRADVAADPTFARRMLDEARLMNAPRHPGLVDVFGFGALPDGRPFMLMELLEGRSLYDVLKARGSLPADEALRVLGGVLEPLAATHASGVVHRDLKPSNIFVLDGPKLEVKLLDFGVAKSTAMSVPDGEPQTLAGTPGFMAPELLSGAPATPASDLYALGCVLYEMLTGKMVFEARTAFERMRAHVDQQPRPPSQVAPAVPALLDAFVLSLLEKQPSRRPASAEAVRQTTLELLGRLDGPPPSELRIDVVPEAPRRSRAPLVLAVVALLAGGGGAAWWLAPRETNDAPPPVAEAPQPAPAPAPAVPAAPEEPPAEPAGAVAKAAAPKKERPRTPRAKPADPQQQRRSELAARLGAIDAWIARARSQGRPTDFQESTVALVRKKLGLAKTEADLDALEKVVAQLEAGTR